MRFESVRTVVPMLLLVVAACGGTGGNAPDMAEMRGADSNTLLADRVAPGVTFEQSFYADLRREYEDQSCKSGHIGSQIPCTELHAEMTNVSVDPSSKLEILETTPGKNDAKFQARETGSFEIQYEFRVHVDREEGGQHTEIERTTIQGRVVEPNGVEDVSVESACSRLGHWSKTPVPAESKGADLVVRMTPTHDDEDVTVDKHWLDGTAPDSLVDLRGVATSRVPSAQAIETFRTGGQHKVTVGLEIDAQDPADRATMTTPLDSSFDRTILLVEPGDFQTMDLEPLRQEVSWADEPGVLVQTFLSPGAATCGDMLEFRAEVASGSSCALRTPSAESSSASARLTTTSREISVDGPSGATCDVTVRAPQMKDGQGVSESISVDID